VNGFFKFVVRGNVIGLAVGVVLGAAFSTLVGKFVEAFLTPLVGLATRASGDYTNKSFILGGVEFPYGKFIDGLISFALISAVIYFLVVLPVNKIAEELSPHHDLSKAKRACPECLQQIPAEARRCSYCTSPVDPILDEDSEALTDENPGEISLSGPIAFRMPGEPARPAEGAAAAVKE
jgi:large conductance mechanosensitive channel